ncbi:MAG TPA: hypothetical protein VHZ51_04210 [Ktedonobacteraceae bacterium]|jgi:hypothetical protein|nr:hypothetical protein [Ktedonobacteraceae bacterium]
MINRFQKLARLFADENAFTNELFAFVTDPNANNRNEREIVDLLHDYAPQVVSVAECMIIDGVHERRFVADYVRAFMHGEGSFE